MRKRLVLSALTLILGLAAATAYAQPALPPCCQTGQTAQTGQDAAASQAVPQAAPQTAPIPADQSALQERLAADQAALSALLAAPAPDMEKAKALMNRIVDARVALGVAGAQTAPGAAYGCPYAAGPAVSAAPYGCPYAVAESGAQGVRKPYRGYAPTVPANPGGQGAALPPCCQ